MKLIAVIKHLNLVVNICSGFFSAYIPFFMGTFDFQGMEETFNYGIISAVPLSADTAGHAILF